MTESQLRDRIAENIGIIEPGLTLLSKEKYIPHPLGTKSFIDLYARDAQGHHVLIELKKSNATSREALHEIHKYVEAVKNHLGAKNEEIRVIVASTEWHELLVPFSLFLAEAKLAVSGLQLHIDKDSSSVTASPVSVLPTTKGRFIAPWHDVNWYLDQESLDKGIASIEASCKVKGINDYVIVVLQPPQPIHSDHQAAMRLALKRMAEMQGSVTTNSELPSYAYIAYFAMQTLSPDRYLHILERDPDKIQEAKETSSGMEADERLCFLHESVSALEPRPNNDHYEIGYAGKFIRFLNDLNCQIQSVRRYGIFERNQILADEAISAELRGEDGSTGQKFRRTLNVKNPAHIASARADIMTCLAQNPVWKNHISKVVDEIETEFPDSEVDISVYSPGTGVLTLFFAMSRDDGFLYLPTYSVIVRNPEATRMYYGALQAEGSALTFRQILNKYYGGDLWGLLCTMTWGGREPRDVDIIEDLGLAYRSFRCDIEGEKRIFFALRDERWRPSDPIEIFSLFGEYLQKNEKLVRQIVTKIGARTGGGLVDGTSVEQLLDEKAELSYGKKLGKFFVGAPNECDLCHCPFSEEKYMIDGEVKEIGAWAFMCADCFGFSGAGVGWGIGQLYLREGDKWLLVAGFSPVGEDEEESI